MIPCVECLVYSACKHRIQVECHDLIVYIRENPARYGSIKKFLPSMSTVMDSEPPKSAGGLKAMAFRKRFKSGKPGWGILSTY